MQIKKEEGSKNVWRKKTLTLLVERLAEDNRLPAEEAKRILRVILFKIDQWKARK